MEPELLPRRMPIIELVKLIVRMRYERHMPGQKKAIIIAAGQECGLLDSEGEPTADYFALMNDDAVKLASELMGWPSKRPEGQCPCGCGRLLKGRARTAMATCRKRMQRRNGAEKVTDVTLSQKTAL